MTKLDQLIGQIEAMEDIATVKALKHIIEASPVLLERYQSMLAMQKRLVRETVDGQAIQAAKTQVAIDQIRTLLENDPIVHEYMNGLESIQETIDLVVDILNQEFQRQ